MKTKNVIKAIDLIKGEKFEKTEILYIFNTILLLKKQNELNWQELIKNIDDFRKAFCKIVAEMNGPSFSGKWIQEAFDVELRNLMSLFVKADVKNAVYDLYRELFAADESYKTDVSIALNTVFYDFVSGGIDYSEVETIYDPAFGIGEGFLSIFKHRDYLKFQFFGQEIDSLLWSNMKTVFAIFDVNSDCLYKGDTLSNPLNVTDEVLQQYDLVIVDPPKSEKVKMAVFESDEHMRFKYGKSESSEIYFLEHGIRSTKKDGLTVISVKAGVLKSSEEKIIRKNLIYENNLDAIIQFTRDWEEDDCILIISPRKRLRETMLIDFTQVAKPNASDIIKLYRKPETIDGISLLYDQKNFRQTDYNLLPSDHIEKEVFESVTDDIVDLKSREKIAIEEIAEITSGISTAVKKLSRKRTATDTNAISFVKNSDIESDGTIRLKDEPAQWYEAGIRGIERTILEEDDIVLLTRGGLNKVGIVKDLPKDKKLGAGMNTIKIRVNKELYSPYLLFELLKSKYGNYLMNRIILASGGLKNFITIREFTQLQMPVYTKKERESFDGQYKQIHEKEAALRHQLEEIKRQKEIIIKDVFNKR
jgi:hypothetical protein